MCAKGRTYIDGREQLDLVISTIRAFRSGNMTPHWLRHLTHSSSIWSIFSNACLTCTHTSCICIIFSFYGCFSGTCVYIKCLWHMLIYVISTCVHGEASIGGLMLSLSCTTIFVWGMFSIWDERSQFSSSFPSASHSDPSVFLFLRAAVTDMGRHHSSPLMLGPEL